MWYIQKPGRRKGAADSRGGIPEQYRKLFEDGAIDSTTVRFLEDHPEIGLVDGVLFDTELHDLCDESRDDQGCPDFFRSKMVCFLDSFISMESVRPFDS